VIGFRKTRQDDGDRAAQARLDEAEARVRNLRDRADRAITTLGARQERNGFRESIETMIHGGAL